MKKGIFLWSICLLCTLCGLAQKTVRLSSPDKQLACIIKTGEHGISYQINFKNKPIIKPSAFTLEFDGQEAGGTIKTGKAIFRDSVEKYDLFIGKTNHVQEKYSEVLIPVEEIQRPFTKFNIIFRAFNDGIAFRYEIKEQKGTDSFRLSDERTEIRVAGNPVTKALILPNFTSSQEGPYSTAKLDAIPGDTLIAMPTLFQFDSNIFLSITEAALLNHAGMYLIKRDNILQSVLSPLPSDKKIKVRGGFPHKSPWRVFMITDRVGGLLESNILTSLCPPSRIKDASWLKPGKTTFPWWNGNVVPDTLNAPGNNFVTQQYFIDFCARNKIEYHSVVEHGSHQWYTDDGVGFQPGPNPDVTRPVPGLDMKEVCDYAHRKGVGVRVWVHWAALYPKLDTAFAVFEKWGLSGMMIDFMDRDDQDMVNIQTEMLEKAARHHLHVQFHGAYKPTGLSRTYPNEFTREGTLNYEVNKWSEGLSPGHDLDVVFTRLIAGSTDYHLGGFRAVPDSLYRTQYTRPLMHGTRSHMLAMYVVLENAIGMVCDYPAAYEGEPGFDFITQVPVTWDETRVLDARVDEYIVIARRKKEDWYIGALTDDHSREIQIPLGFLQNAEFSAQVYGDSDDAGRFPNHIKKEERNVRNTDSLTLKLAAGGGAAIHISKK